MYKKELNIYIQLKQEHRSHKTYTSYLENY